MLVLDFPKLQNAILREHYSAGSLIDMSMLSYSAPFFCLFLVYQSPPLETIVTIKVPNGACVPRRPGSGFYGRRTTELTPTYGAEEERTFMNITEESHQQTESAVNPL